MTHEQIRNLNETIIIDFGLTELDLAAQEDGLLAALSEIAEHNGIEVQDAELCLLAFKHKSCTLPHCD